MYSVVSLYTVTHLLHLYPRAKIQIASVLKISFGAASAMRRGSVPLPLTPQEMNGSGTPYTPRTPLSARRITNDENTPEETDLDRRQKELHGRQQHILREQRLADQDALLTAIASKLLSCFA